VVLEFLRDGEEVSAGESGEVVATSLFRWATPMIRYYLGDMATPLDDECPCGRGLPLLKNIEGRVVDFIRRPDGGSVSPYAIMHVLQDVSGLEQFKVVQRNDYSIEVLVRVSGDLESVLNEVENRCNLLFRGLRFRVFPVESIRAGRGEKFRVVESHVTV
jgi:phenylacetate-CoA ligase